MANMHSAAFSHHIDLASLAFGENAMGVCESRVPDPPTAGVPCVLLTQPKKGAEPQKTDSTCPTYPEPFSAWQLRCRPSAGEERAPAVRGSG